MFTGNFKHITLNHFLTMKNISIFGNLLRCWCFVRITTYTCLPKNTRRYNYLSLNNNLNEWVTKYCLILISFKDIYLSNQKLWKHNFSSSRKIYIGLITHILKKEIMLCYTASAKWNQVGWNASINAVK